MARRKMASAVENIDEIATVPKEEWPYELPEGWKWVRGRSIFEPMETKLPTGNQFRYIDIDSINNNKQTVETPKCLFVKDAPSRASRGLKNGDTVFSLVRPYLRNIAYIDASLADCIASTGFYVCRPNYLVDGKYLYWLMTSDYVVDGLMHFMKGDNSPSIKKNDIEHYLFPIAPKGEQPKLVKTIEAFFAKLDNAKGLVRNALDSSETRKAAILHKAFTGELTAKWRKENNIGINSWGKSILGDTINVSSGKSLTTKNMKSTGNIPVYGGNGITGYHDKSNVTPNTLIIGRVGFYCGIIHYIKEPAWITDNALIVSFNNKKIDINFLYYLLSYTNLRETDSSTAQPVISGSKIYPIKVLLPRYLEQKEIAKTLDQYLRNEKSAVMAMDVINKIEMTKKAILNMAFHGNL